MSTRRPPQAQPSPKEDFTARVNGATTRVTAAVPIPPRVQRSPFIPTSLEASLLAIYPVTLLLGSFFSTISPASRAAPYNPYTQSHPPELAPSYFAKKKNLFNVYFVKVGWFWTTLAFVLFLFSHASFGPRGSFVITPRRGRALLRYTMMTAVWCAVTQWFFGPPIIDRGFTFSGGQCEILRDTYEGQALRDEISKPRHILTHAACKVAGGQWKGGHDISGHVFLLILGSVMLWMEILPVVLRAEGLREERRITMADGKNSSAAAEAAVPQERDSKDNKKELGVGIKFSLCVAALSWWMLLMTAAYFHTWFEKFTGLLVAFLGVWVVYFLPRGVPAMRAIVGMPGL